MSPLPEAFVLPVDKPAGPTSHDVVASVRRRLGVRRVGHTGTLDPFATGLLLICVGRATRLAEYLTGLSKTYVATARLGVTTETEDTEGQVRLERGGWEALTRKDVEAAMLPLTGQIAQVPPQFSAKKVDGVAMHRRARRGEVVALPPRSVVIHELALVDIELPSVRFSVRCSSGTYIRSLARDLGEALGVGAHLTALRRTHIDVFDVATAVPLSELDTPGRIEGAMLAPLRAIAHMPRVQIEAADVHLLCTGRPIAVPSGVEGVPSAVAIAAAEGDDLVAVVERSGDALHPRKVFVAA